MKARYFAAATAIVQANPHQVWQALTDPAIIKQFMFGSTVTTDWHVGSPITFAGEWEGKPYEDKGEIIRAMPDKCLTMTYYSPLSGKEDSPENYQAVGYLICENKNGTELFVVQDNAASKEEAEQSQQNWQMVLASMKKLLEAH
jgi:uncharacterized protein YndB with AHSA1/START domain